MSSTHVLPADAALWRFILEFCIHDPIVLSRVCSNFQLIMESIIVDRCQFIGWQDVQDTPGLQMTLRRLRTHHLRVHQYYCKIQPRSASCGTDAECFKLFQQWDSKFAQIRALLMDRVDAMAQTPTKSRCPACGKAYGLERYGCLECTDIYCPDCCIGDVEFNQDGIDHKFCYCCWIEISKPK